MPPAEPEFCDGAPIDSDGPFIVVGANGFLGSEICMQLRRRNRWARIVAPMRHEAAINPRIDGLKLTIVRVPIVDEAAMEQCLRAAADAGSRVEAGSKQGPTVAGIFHVAGMVTFLSAPADIADMMASNVTLADTVLRFATNHNLRTVYASCSAIVGCQFLDHGDRVSHDDTRRCEATIESFPFLTQKRDVELYWHQEALKGRAPIIFLRPSVLLGPGDEKVRSTFCIFELLSGLGALPIRYGGGISFCDVRDVGAAFVQCMLGNVRGGTAMNLTAANLPYDDFVALVESTLRISCTSLIPYRWSPRLPPAALRLGASVASRCRQWLRRPDDERCTPTFVESRLRYYNVTCQRAKALIRWDPRDLEDTIQDTAKYLVHAVGADVAGRLQHRTGHRSRVVGLPTKASVASLSWQRRCQQQQHGGSARVAKGVRWWATQRFVAMVLLLALLAFAALSAGWV